MLKQDFVYLDYAASAPLRESALRAQEQYEKSPYAGANPNSLHTLGRMAANALNGARRDLATALSFEFRPQNVVFTSGGTESNNLAVLGLAEQLRSEDSRRNIVLLSSIEHDSVLDLSSTLQRRGFDVHRIPASSGGVIEPQALLPLLNQSCAVVSVMAANNETGIIQPIRELAEAAHAVGARFHTDASQGFCKVHLDVGSCDAVSISGHKIGAPVGIGALVLKSGIRITPLFYGGGQEDGRRAGTQDVRGALAFAACAKELTQTLDKTRAACAAKANKLYRLLCFEGSRVHATTTSYIDDTRLPGIVSILVDNADSQSLILALDDLGFEVSAASACSSESKDISHVLKAMGVSDALSAASLRISFDERVAEADLNRFADALLYVLKS